jgi:hypothetical protein
MKSSNNRLAIFAVALLAVAAGVIGFRKCIFGNRVLHSGTGTQASQTERDGMFIKQPNHQSASTPVPDKISDQPKYFASSAEFV